MIAVAPSYLVFVYYGLLPLLVILVFLFGLKKVREGEAVVIERLGKFHRVLTAGLHIINPVIDVPKRVNWGSLQVVDGILARKQLQTTLVPYKKEIVFDPQPVTCMTKGGVSVDIDVAVRFVISDVEKCVYQVDDLFLSLQILLETSLFKCVQDCDIPAIMGGREMMKLEVTERLNVHAQKWGVNVVGVDIQKVQMPEELEDALLKKITSEQENSANLIAEEGRRKLELSKLDSQAAIDKKNHENNMAKIEWERKEMKERVAIEVEVEKIKAQAKDDVARILFGQDLEARNNYISEEMKAKLLLGGANTSTRTVLIPHDMKLASTVMQPFVSVN